MEQRNSNMKQALKAAVQSAFFTFCGIVLVSLVRTLIDWLFDGKWQLDWRLIGISGGVGSAVVFICIFVSVCWSLHTAAPAIVVLDRVPSLSLPSEKAMTGFVAMEYYALILNRTYVIFVTVDGLFGWKARGPVTNANPHFFEPYQGMLEDPELMRDQSAVGELSKLNGGFRIRSEDIAGVEASDKSKWGMGGIPHSGRILVRLTGGRSREFIVLGSVSPTTIREKICMACQAPQS